MYLFAKRDHPSLKITKNDLRETTLLGFVITRTSLRKYL